MLIYEVHATEMTMKQHNPVAANALKYNKPKIYSERKITDKQNQKHYQRVADQYEDL